MTVVACTGSALLIGAWPRATDAVRWIGVGAMAAVIHPALGMLAPIILLAAGVAARRGSASRGTEVLPLADQVALGLRAGLTMEGALREAGTDLAPAMTGEVMGVLRAARHSGLGPALAGASGSGERLFRITADAVQTGAPLAPAVEALAGELRHEDHASRMAAARRLPVRLLLPLALLILPGFVLVVIGPALLGSLARLEIGW